MCVCVCVFVSICAFCVIMCLSLNVCVFVHFDLAHMCSLGA